MPDIPGNSATTANLSVGSTTAGSLETIGDRDWYRITLSAGQTVTVALNASSFNGVEDPYLRIRDSAGNLLFENDDGGEGLNSRVTFTANYTGTYYVDVGSWEDRYDGEYQLSVARWTPPPVGTVDQLANQLVSGYWEGQSHRFNVGQGGSLSVNLTALTPAGQSLAREALLLWTDIIGVNFVEVLTGGQITFDDNEEGAHASANYSGGITSSAHINVEEAWLQNYGTSLNGYAFQTYIHEIGHALGLGHAGNYNGEGQYPYDALYQIDGWPLSIMSYFDQQESTYYGQQGFSRNFIVTPMQADILAMSMLYGVSSATRTGNTTYGFNSNAGRAVYNASLHPGVGYTVFDSGGTDTLDYSGFAAAQIINLNAESFSNVGGRVGNVSIARGVVIENAVGGAGSDQLIGNGAGNTLTGGGGADRLTGGGGADTFAGTAAELNGDSIADMTGSDRIVVTNASLASFTFSLSGSALSFSGGSVNLLGVSGGEIVVAAAAGGGVELRLVGATLSSGDAANDFNGDGRSDVLWRSTSGQLSNWLGQASGGFAGNDGNALRQVQTSWQVAGTGDFNGDGRDDILWRNTGTGQISNWLGQPNGGFVVNDANAAASVSTSWQVAGTGDFNGDGRDDILWRSASGQLSDWLGQANGGFVGNDGNALRQVQTSWQVAGTGDFNGDGRDDILWRNPATGQLSDWLGQANGGFAVNDANAFASAPTNWHVVGTGDFNGDGRDDILWRGAAGQTSNWLGQVNGGFAVNDANALHSAPTSWHVADTGDYNGDGRDDVLWRSDSGQLSNWLGQANAGFVNNDANAFASVATSWQVQSPDTLWV